MKTQEELIEKITEQIIKSLDKSIKVSEIMNDCPMDTNIKRRGLLASAYEHYFEMFLDVIDGYEEATGKDLSLNELRDMYAAIMKGVDFDALCQTKSPVVVTNRAHN